MKPQTFARKGMTIRSSLEGTATYGPVARPWPPGPEGNVEELNPRPASKRREEPFVIMITLGLPIRLHAQLRAAVSTGLFGHSVEDAAEQLMCRGVQSAIDAGILDRPKTESR